MSKRRIPQWWGWPLVFPRHIRERMRQRGFSETDVRNMLFAFHRIRPADDLGRWLVDSDLDKRSWRIVLEPDHQDRTIVEITANPVEHLP